MKKKVAYLGLFASLCMICSYIESLIPIYLGVPGAKIGLANLVVLVALYLFGPKEAFVISLLRIFCLGFLFGNGFSIVYSLAGGILSFLVMWLLSRSKKLKPISVSTAGGISHNLGQLCIAAIFVKNASIWAYFPFLMLAGTLTGFLIGILGGELIFRLKKVIHL